MKFTAWLESRTAQAIQNKGFDPRLHKKTRRAERIWQNYKEKQRKNSEDTTQK
jgi:hypothetical protein